MRLIGAFFDLTDRFAPSTAAASRRDNAADGRNDKILISVAKRLVPSAVRRNTVKRIVREAWRAALRDQPVRASMQEAVQQDVQQEVQECLIRLKRYPGARTEPGLATIKRSLRADADQLFATYLNRRPVRRSMPNAGSKP
ncbi:MAG: ribonuclease P protein component [Lautropia sp.]|nr:ribonuclease P protein component [Lautropia sp.]